MKLDNLAIQVLKLVERSPRDDEGWSKVSRACWSLLYSLPPELVEMMGNKQEGGVARLTEEGKTIVKWL